MKAAKAIIDDKRKEFEAEELLLATGRTPNTDRLNASKASVVLNGRGFVQVDSHMQTSAPNIWAAGDVISEPMLETIARRRAQSL